MNLTTRHSPGFPKAGKPHCARPGLFPARPRRAYRARLLIYRHPKGSPRIRTRHGVADSAFQRPAEFKSPRKLPAVSRPTPKLADRSSRTRRQQSRYSCLTSSASAAARWRARAAEKMSPTPPLFSLPEARTRFTVSGPWESATLTRLYPFPPPYENTRILLWGKAETEVYRRGVGSRPRRGLGDGKDALLASSVCPELSASVFLQAGL